MSLILEALRKSEAERRRGQSPDLYAELPPPSRRATKHVLPWHWLLLAAGTLAIAGWAARGYWNEPTKGAPNAVAANNAGDHVDIGPAASVVAPPAVAAAPSAAAPSAVAPPPARIDGDSIPPVMPTAAPPRPAATSLPNPTPTAAPPAPARPAPSLADTPVVAAPMVASVTPRDTIVPAPTPVAQIELPAEPTSPPRAESPTAPAITAPLRLSDLSTAERQQLPPLKISMHMWGQGPAQRFAIIDGTRVTEGDRLGEAVVDEISSDGVVLSWNGLHVKLPVR
jgi:general secretion pathway protein B